MVDVILIDYWGFTIDLPMRVSPDFDMIKVPFVPSFNELDSIVVDYRNHVCNVDW